MVSEGAAGRASRFGFLGLLEFLEIPGIPGWGFWTEVRLLLVVHAGGMPFEDSVVSKRSLQYRPPREASKAR